MSPVANASRAPARQVAMVFDLNKCMGCQSCAVACKMLWTREPGEEQQWWCTVNTQPGRGAPRDWETMGGGYRDGRLELGREPTREEIGGGWSFNQQDVFFGGRGRAVHLEPRAKDTRPSGDPTGTRTRAPASTRTPISSTCRASATTARGRPASRPVRMAR